MSGETPAPKPQVVTRLVGDLVVPADGSGDLIVDGGVDIDASGRIVAVGPLDALGDGPVPSTTGGLLMPGLVNAHAHTPMTLVRSVADGLPLRRWLQEGVWPLEAKMTADDVYWGMMLGSVEMLSAGVTTSCEMYLHEDAMVSAVTATGGRLVVTPGVIAALAPGGNLDGRLGQISDCHRQHHDPSGRITVGYGPHSIYDLAPTQVGEISAEARSRGALLHIHLEETAHEREEVMAANGGRSATRLLADHGVLEGPVLAAHGVWLDETDRRLLGEAGAAVAHCPQSNLKLGSGVAAVPAMIADGIEVAVGTDGPASNDDLDLWEELRLAPLLARGTLRDPQAMDAMTALALATAAAARALSLPDVGELRPGAQADVIRLDLDNATFTPLRAETALTQLVFAGSGRHVTDVWVGGRHVVVDRQVTTVDVGRVREQCQARAERIAS